MASTEERIINIERQLADSKTGGELDYVESYNVDKQHILFDPASGKMVRMSGSAFPLENGKSHPSRAAAMAVTPLPANNVIFSVDKYLPGTTTPNPEAGVYAYDSTASGGNRKVNELLAKTQVVELGNSNVVESDAVAKEINPIKANFVRDEPFYYDASTAVLSQIPTGRTIIRNLPLTKSFSFKSFRIYVSQAGVLQVGIFEKPTGTDVKAIKYSAEITVNAGNQIIQLPAELTTTAGQYIGFYLKTARTYVDTSKAGQMGGARVYTGGKIEVGATQTTASTTNYDLFSLIETVIVDDKLKPINERVGVLEADIVPIKANFTRDEQFYYNATGANLVSIPTNRTIIRNQALTKNRAFKFLRIFTSHSGILQVGIYDKPTSTSIRALKYSAEITVNAGNQIIQLPAELTTTAGQYIGVYLKTARINVDFNRNGELGGDRVYTGGKIELDATQETSGTANYDLFSLIEVLTVDDKIENVASGKQSIGTASKLPTNSSAVNGITPNPLFIADPFGTNQPLHPTVMHFPSLFNGYLYVMVQTPYPRSGMPLYKDRYECPTIHYSMDGVNWTAGVLIDDLTESEITNQDYFSDPELVYNSTLNQLECWYRITRGSVSENGTSILRKIINTNGTIGARETIFTEVQLAATAPTMVRSQALIFEGGKYKMWFTGRNGGNVGYGETTTPLVPSSWTWQAVTLGIGSTSSWHLDIEKVGSTYYLFNCTTSYDMQLYSSSDGLAFNKVKDILVRTNNPKDFYGNVIYRSSPLVVNGVFSLYVSGWNLTNGYSSIGLMRGESFEDLKLIDGGFVRNDFRVDGNIRLGNTAMRKSMIELDDRGNAIGFDYQSKTLFFLSDDGNRYKIFG